MNFHFWQNVPSIHQGPLLEALYQRGHVVTLVTEAALPIMRSRMGWQEPSLEGVRHVEQPDHGERIELLRSAGDDTVHIFSGLGAYPSTHKSLMDCLRLVRSHETLGTVALYLEPIDSRGVSGMVRRSVYHRRARQVRTGIDFLLVTGRTAREQLVRLGFPSDRIVPFAYFAESRIVGTDTQGRTWPWPRSADSHVFGFVGQIVARKRLDWLLRALARYPHEKWSLVVVGNGVERAACERLANDLGIADRISWLGALPNAQIPAVIAGFDTLVLPSSFDGWGVVVNEAVAVGTPAVVSSHVGCAEMVERSPGGVVFDGDEPESLERAVQIRLSASGNEDRAGLATWANERLSAPRGAEYLEEVAQAYRRPSGVPIAPWLS